MQLIDLGSYADLSQKLRVALGERWSEYCSYIIVWLVVGAAGLRAMLRYGHRRPPPLGADGALFLISGRRWVAGQPPYLTLWDIKPPVVHEFAALAAFVTGSDPVWMYIIGVATTLTTLTLSAVFIAAIVHYYIKTPWVAVVAGVAPLVYDPWYLLVRSPFRPKFLMLFFALAGFLCYLHRRPMAAGFLSALAAASWQMGLVFPLVVAIGVYRRGERRAEWAVTVGMVTAAVLVIMPVAVSGAVLPMLAQVVLTPFVGGEQLAFQARIGEALDHLGMAQALVLLGASGAVLSGMDRAVGDERIWILVFAGWYLLQVFQFDLDGPPDLLPLVAVSAIGVGVLLELTQRTYAQENTSRIAPGTAVVIVLLIVPLIIGSPWGIGHEARWYDRSGGQATEFWATEPVDGCHVRLSSAEKRWITSTPAERSDEQCWPNDIEAVLSANEGPSGTG